MTRSMHERCDGAYHGRGSSTTHARVSGHMARPCSDHTPRGGRALGKAALLGGVLLYLVACVVDMTSVLRPVRGPRLTARDLDIIRWIGRYGVVTTAQVERHFFTGERAAYRRVRALLALGLLRRDMTFWKEPAVLRVTPAGARLVNLPVAPAELVLAEVRHSLALVDLTEQLLAESSGAHVLTERELRADALRARRQDRDYTGYARIPDALLVQPTGLKTAVELDLTSKRTAEVLRMIDAYTHMFTRNPERLGVAQVLWYVLPADVARVRNCVAAKESDGYMTVRAWRR